MKYNSEKIKWKNSMYSSKRGSRITREWQIMIAFLQDPKEFIEELSQKR